MQSPLFSLTGLPPISHHQRVNHIHVPGMSHAQALTLSGKPRAEDPRVFARNIFCKVDEKGRFLIPLRLGTPQAEGNQVMFP